MLRVSRFFAALIALALGLAAVAEAATLPADFSEVGVAGGWNEAVGLSFTPEGRMFVWERGGRVWTVEGGVKSPSPFIDLSAEVGGWRDFGLLGFALHPGFRSNGLIYLYYVVDRHHLDHCNEPAAGFGEPVCDGGYSATTNDYFTAAIGRIVRYRAVLPTGDPDYLNATSVDYSSRVVLVGENHDNGFPILHQSHGTGSLVFGTDGTLLASCGDAASYSSTDTGSASETYWNDALAAGIISTKENVGAWRSQLVDSLNGKVIRIDPLTGDGLPSNPFFDASDARSAASRTWALGLRNPYRMSLRPETGSHDVEAGDPGVLYIGDVGWKKWEDLHVNATGGENFGWPYFEGLTAHTDSGGNYPNSNAANLDAPNPLFNGGTCNIEYLRFRDLIVQDICPTCSPSWPNPCNAGQQIPPTAADLFVHTRPPLDWRHGSLLARSGYFDAGGTARELTVGDPLPPGATGTPVAGAPFAGNASTGGVWYTGTSFPPAYQNTYFHGDYGGQWIRNFVFDANDTLLEVRDFLTGGGGIVAIASDPIAGDLYYISWASNVRRVYYDPAGNQPPAAAASITDVNAMPWSETAAYGASPLSVTFRGADSSDPEMGSLTYSWNFGDGGTSTDANPTHTFDPTGAISSPTRFDVLLTVTDDNSQIDSTAVIVSINNSPPSVTITSPADGEKYPMSGDSVYPLTATLSDSEHSAGQLSCEWQTVLHHNEHTHAEPIDTNCTTQTVISPLGCGTETYYYSVSLKVTDAAGLATTEQVQLLPDCSGLALNADAGPDQTVFDIDGSGDETVLLDGSASSDPNNAIVAYRWYDVDVLVATGATPSVNLPLGVHSLTLDVENDIAENATDTVVISVNAAGNQAPNAVINAAPVSGIVPLNVSFSASGSSDPDGTIVAWDWTFGDGSSDSGEIVSHTYIAGGTYSAVLTVTDDDGDTGTANVMIVVADVWWDTDWTRARVLTLDNSASGSDLDDFPLLITLDPTRIDYAAAQANGADLRFIDADGVTVLDHQIETFVPGGTSRIWVRVPRIDAGSSTDSITLYYGNPAAADTQNPAGVFSANYAAVWHLNDTLDSTANANHGTAFGAATSAGVIGGGYVFSGAGEYIDAGADASLALTGAITLEAWAQFDATATGAPRILSKKNEWRDAEGYNLEYKPSASQLSTLGSGSNVGSATNVVLGTSWHYLVAINDNGTARLYVDGVQLTTDSTVSTLIAGPQALSLGRRSGGAAYLDGMLDEVRISTTARSDDWIGAQYRSMTDALVSVGNEVVNDNLAPEVSIIDPTSGATFVTPVDITLEAAASDPDGIVVQVDYYTGQNLVGSALASPWSILWSNVPQGNHVLTAVATDDGNATRVSAPVSITVNSPPQPPSITAQPQDQTVNEGQSAPFTVAADGSAPLAFQWRVNGNDISGANGSAYTTPALTTASDGDLYSVVVSNAHGSVASNNALLTVNAVPNNPPSVNAGPDLAAETGVTMHIDTATASDDGLPIPPATLDLLWTSQSGPATPQFPLGDQDQAHVHVSFPLAGVYVLRLTADDSELDAFDELTVTVSDTPNQLPSAVITAGPLSGPAPLTVNFDASGSSDPDGMIVAWDWTFGDGGTDSGETVGYTYNAGGSFSATLTVTDNAGGTDVANVTVTVADAWWDTDWTRARVLTLDNSASGSDLDDFPLLITLDPTRIDYAAAQANGADLRFIDADGVTVLDHQIETFVPGGTSRIWVRVPRIDAGSSTDSITLYYGNPAAADTQNPAGVFSANYAAVWHLNDTLDSTANANHGTAFGAATSAGVIGGGYVFSGAGEYIDAGADASLALTGAITLEAWAQFDATATGAPRILSKKNEWRDAEGYNLEYKPSASQLSTLGSGSNVGSATNVVLGTSWHYLVAINDNGTARLYVDGVQLTTDSTVSTLIAGPQALSLGRRSGGAAYLDGMLDEVRISTTARSDDWIGAQYRSMTDALVSVGNEVINDNFAPTVSLTSPASGTAYAPPVDISMTASAFDSDGTVVKVDFYAGTTLLGTDTVEPWAFTWLGATEGAHQLTAAATDDAGARTVSAPVSVSVFPPPQVTIDAPLDAASVGGPDITVLYSLAGNPDVYNHLHLTLDALPHVTIMDLSGSYTFTDVAPGSHTVTAQLVDASHVPLGNPESSDSATFNVTAPPPPTISSHPVDQTRGEGQTATFSVAASGAGTLVYQWRLGGGNIAGANDAAYTTPALTLADDGNQYDVVVSNTGGAVVSNSATLTVTTTPNDPPTASFTTDTTSGPAPLNVNFDASGSMDSDGTIVSWNWAFGDGGSDSSETVAYTYNTGGSFSATLTVTDNDGASDVISLSINVADSWWDTDWSAQRLLTIDNSASTTDLDNFPLLITLDPTRINYAAAQANGADLRFIDADGVTVLDHQIETFVPGGTSRVWVRVPRIDAGSSSDSITLYYGNPAAVDAQNAAGVFSANYAAVWHLNDTLDSTANANHGTAFGAATSAGVIGGGYVFSGAGEYIDAGADASLALTGAITLEAWAQFDATASGAPRILSKKNEWRDAEGYNLEYKPSGSQLSTLGSGSNIGSASGVALGTAWHYLVAINDNGNARLYVDGIEVTTDSTVSTLIAGSQALSLGRRSGGAAYLDGMLDEVRISSAARSADWIGAQYRSMTDAMISYGP